MKPKHRHFRCQPCGTDVELEATEYQVRKWQCPGCAMHVDGRPSDGSDGVSGLPMWLSEQLWGTSLVLANEALREHLFSIVRAPLRAAAEGTVDLADVPTHAMKVLEQVVRELKADVVPAHSKLEAWLSCLDVGRAGGLRAFFRPMLLKERSQMRVILTAKDRPASAGMFQFDYVPADGNWQLYTCYTVWRQLPKVTLGARVTELLRMVAGRK